MRDRQAVWMIYSWPAAEADGFMDGPRDHTLLLYVAEADDDDGSGCG